MTLTLLCWLPTLQEAQAFARRTGRQAFLPPRYANTGEGTSVSQNGIVTFGGKADGDAEAGGAASIVLNSDPSPASQVEMNLRKKSRNLTGRSLIESQAFGPTLHYCH